jgi:poly(A) polymerase
MNYGVAAPFSVDGPSMFENQQSDSMEDFLFSSGAIYETPAGERMRFAVIDKLRSVVCEWATAVGSSKSVDSDIYAGGGGIQLRIFGSTRLGVHNTDSDIDMLCLAPSFVSRSDFFTGLRELLAERDDTSAVLPIPDAYTPVLKFTIDGQAIDMVFASLHMPRLPDNLDILDLRLLRGLDDASVRSINGPRVAEWILRLVPNVENFCSALRVIKYWARQRGLYSNMLGFLGGISYAILVAHVCQLFVCACPFTLVHKFFEVYALRDWRNHPVMLRSYEDALVEDSEGRALPVWNARANPKDAAHLMPITPAYPAMNSAFNVSWPQHIAIKVLIMLLGSCGATLTTLSFQCAERNSPRLPDIPSARGKQELSLAGAVRAV